MPGYKPAVWFYRSGNPTVNGLHLALLGQLDIRQNGVPLADFESRKAQALLCYLAVTRQKHSRAVLAGLLWPEIPEVKALMNLRKAVTLLHRYVDEHVHVTRRSLAFNFDTPYRLDVGQFEVAMSIRRDVSPATVEVMKEALDLYRGEFLAEFYVRDALPFEEWMLAQRARLQELALDGLYRLAVYYYKQGAFEDALGYTRRLLALEPWREEAHRQQMMLLAQMGQRSEALVQYENCRRVLAEELGITPSAETEALATAIRAGNPGTGGGGRAGREESTPAYQPLSQSPPQPATPSPMHNLPAQRTPFVGREAETSDIVRWLQDRACRLLTLAGPGGIGKTRLAIQAAQYFVDSTRQEAVFADGVFFVPLDEVSSAEFLAPAIANSLNFPLYDSPDPEEQLRNCLQRKKVLLLLDNFEHLPEGAELISEILATSPGVKVLVTSREALHIQEEWFQPVWGMAFPRNAAEWPEGITPEGYSAVELFVQCARRARPGFSLNEEASCVVRICQLVEGMPLGIELAAAWIRALSCQTIAQELEQSLDLLTTTWYNLPPHHRSMRAVFDRSWKLLSAAERDVLKRLSVFRDEFRAEEAANVAGASLPQLARLIEKSLLQYTPPGRYRMHELLRQFCAEKLHTAAEDGAETPDKHAHLAPGHLAPARTPYSQEQNSSPTISA
jgi:predicted ATPase/DNA-binding SARP family transcriptional activator